MAAAEAKSVRFHPLPVVPHSAVRYFLALFCCLTSIPAEAETATFQAIAVDVNVAGAPGDGSYGRGPGADGRGGRPDRHEQLPARVQPPPPPCFAFLSSFHRGDVVRGTTRAGSPIA